MQTKLIITVIIPVYNGSSTIERCLDSLAYQTMPRDTYEIVVVDDGSTDNTSTIVNQWISDHPNLTVSLVYQENAGPAAARNYGVQVAQANVLLFTDADCAPLADWIEAMGRPFGLERIDNRSVQLVARETENPIVGVKGAYVTEQSELVPNFVQAEYEDRYDRMRHLPQIDFIDTYSAGYVKEILVQNEGFDPVFTTASVEDQELSFRLAQKGYKMVFEPAAKVSHIHDRNISEYWARKYAIGYWKALLTRWHPERLVQDSHTPQILKIQMVLWAFMLGMVPIAVAGLPLSPLRWIWPVILATLVIFLLTTIPFCRKLANRSLRLTLFGIIMISVRSLALGAGYLHGTIHFAGAVHGMRQPVIPGWKRLTKRILDILIALVGIVCSLPLIVLAAIAIKLDSQGPVFFRQVRIGEHGIPFEMIKLRSMVNNAEDKLNELISIDDLTEPSYKIKDDPRVTRVGRILRRTSLDETPQFINVLRGDMSVVGPRPEESRLVALYNDKQRKRLNIKPGITGPMQVRGRGNLSLSERLQLEQEYIDNYSLVRDLQLICQTFPAIFRGDGAY